VGPGGVPTPYAPSYSFALPQPLPLGVPDFFIQSFQIPPFLLPIYQAAGIEYDVPWQVLAAINEIETDYGRNLSISSAGAVGWMQFLPSTWRRWGVAATGNGIADPYNPVDAIFTAARYLQAAGAARNLPEAIYAYNHAWWYVQSVLLRAQLIGGIPSRLIGALSELVEGHFPLAAPSTYADSAVLARAGRPVRTANAALVVDPSQAVGTNIYSRAGAPVVAVNDGRILAVGRNRSGGYVVLQDQAGNVYIYSHLGQIQRRYPVLRPVRLDALRIARALSDRMPKGGLGGPASAGVQRSSGPIAFNVAPAHAGSAPVAAHHQHAAGPAVADGGGAGRHEPAGAAPAASPATTGGAVQVKERLFAHPALPGAYAAGGAQQLQAQQQIQSFSDYFADVLHLAKNQYTLRPLRPGALVIGGTILGHLGTGTSRSAPHLYFQIRPAGRHSPLIDPKPILDGWKLLAETAIYRAADINPFVGADARNPSIGQALLMSKQQLQERVLADPNVTYSACTGRLIQAGELDRRILAAVEFLSLSGLGPTIQALPCEQQSGSGQAQVPTSIDITAINHIPLLHHQGQGSIADLAIRRLLTLQGALAPARIISAMRYQGKPNTMSRAGYQNRIEISYGSASGSGLSSTVLDPKQWIQLIDRISQIPEPTVPTTTSPYAIKTNAH